MLRRPERFPAPSRPPPPRFAPALQRSPPNLVALGERVPAAHLHPARLSAAPGRHLTAAQGKQTHGLRVEWAWDETPASQRGRWRMPCRRAPLSAFTCIPPDAWARGVTGERCPPERLGGLRHGPVGGGCPGEAAGGGCSTLVLPSAPPACGERPARGFPLRRGVGVAVSL